MFVIRYKFLLIKCNKFIKFFKILILFFYKLVYSLNILKKKEIIKIKKNNILVDKNLFF